LFVVSALRQGRRPGATLERLKAFCGVWRSTVKRWQRYFQDLFAQSISYRRLAGHLMPPIESDRLPGSLIERFCSACGQPEQILVRCLSTLAAGP
jgi:hypothetical protein